MARPYKNDFQQEIQSPMTPVSAGASNTPISYKTNVNRQKTTKWANAKPATYDDWDDDDEYDDEPPPPISKPTGLRQQGQTAPPDSSKKGYGDLPAGPGAADAPRPRANSFDADDETRNFSSGTAPAQRQAPSPAAAPGPGPATRFSQMEHVDSPRTASGPPALSITTQSPLPQSVTGLRKASVPVPSTSRAGSGSESNYQDSAPSVRANSGNAGPSSYSPPASVSDIKASPSDYEARRDYSPSAVPPPLRPAGGAVPAPQSTETPAGTRFPARKSSLSQPAGPDISEITRTSQDSTPKPWTAAPSASSAPAPTSPSTQTKALPFIRPADIYKRRMEEEKERQSLDSSRPSMDSVRSSQTNELSESGITKPGSDGLGSNRRREESVDGAHLRTVLEPVKERKSEYYSEGYNQDSLKSVSGLSEKDKLEAGEMRSQSTSPQLPGLNRMSGFGLDLFSKPKETAPEPVAQEKKRLSRSSLNRDVEPQEAKLGKIPTHNSNTAVSQELEPKNNTSFPATSTSQPHSAIKSSSESAEPADISHITSQQHNTSVSDTSEEPDSPIEATGAVQRENNAKQVSQQYQPYQAPKSTTPPLSKESDVEPLQPPRPIVGRDDSFRPHLPGGWNSYATTPGNEVPEVIMPEASISSVKQASPRSSSPASADISKDHELTPTATKDPVVESLVTPIAAGAAASHLNRDASPSSTHREAKTSPAESNSNAGYLTPDLSMAPSGSLYSNTALDQRLQPKRDGVSPENQLHAGVAKRTSSADSDRGPTPLPKDTPVIVNEQPEYFPKQNVPAKQSTLDQSGAGDQRSQSPDAENDRLHDEIVRNLSPSPKPNNAVQRSDSLGVESLDERNTNAARISSYLPSEYDNYWASTAEEETPAAVITAPAEDLIQKPSQAPDSIPPITTEVPRSTHRELTPEPLSPRKNDRSSQILSPPHRYSWEKSLESVSAPSAQIQVSRPTEEPSQDLYESQGRVNSPSEINHSPSPSPSPSLKPVGNEALRSHPTTPAPDGSFHHAGRDIAGGLAMGSTTTPEHPAQPNPTSERRLSLAEEKDPRVSSYPVSPTPPEDQHPSKIQQPFSSHTNEEIPNPSAISIISAPSNSSAPSGSPSFMNSQAHPQTAQAVSILPFKEIASMPSPHQRIQKYNETRHTFAAMDSGLTTWISNLQTQYPEHAGSTATFGRPTLDHSKLGKSTGGLSPPLQQPYYQQYLNASSPTSPGTPLPRPGPATPVGTQHGFSPAAGITTQQVQAKGKEFLHTAGVFGGKAGKVGKGLLAKGKNKLRGAGGGDKNSSSPPTKPKVDRRTSWGIPLTLSRSSGKTDAHSRNSSKSRATTPVPVNSRQRAATLTLDTTPTRGYGKSPMTAATDDSYAVMSAPGILDDLSNMSGALPAGDTHDRSLNQSTALQDKPTRTERFEPHDEDEYGEQGSLNVPAPIGKHQPSWDSFNATPIMEEEGFHFEDHPQAAKIPDPVDTDSLHHRSTDSDAQPGRASEELSDTDAWVLVPDDADQMTKTSDQPPIIPEILMPQSDFGIEDETDHILENVEAAPDSTAQSIGSAEVNQEPDASGLTVSGRPRAASILDRPRYSYDVPRADGTSASPPRAKDPQFERGSSPTPLVGVPVHAQSPSTGNGKESRPAPAPRKSSWTQAQHEPLDRPRYSYDVPRADQSPGRPPSQTKNVQTSYGPHPINTAVPPTTQQYEQEPQTAKSFQGLPPIRRTSTFGLGFNSRQARKKAAAENEEPVPSLPQQSSDPTRRSFDVAVAAGVATPEGVAHREAHRQSQQYQRQQDQNLPPEAHVGAMMVSAPSTQQLYKAPRAGDADAVRRSQDSWRPNAASRESHGNWGEPNGPDSRASLEQQSRKSYTQRPPSQQPKGWEQPPSSAQRYPALFRAEPSDKDDNDDELPAHYYQAPVTREESFLPRHQTNEYQIPGVGPPTDEPRPASRRNSLLRDLGNKIRSASRERGNSISQEGGPFKRQDTGGTEYAESSVASEDGREPRRKRNSFFSSMHRSSIGEPPQSRESTKAHFAGSRTNLNFTPGQTPADSPIIANDKARAFFGGDRFPGLKPDGNQVSRASLDGIVEAPNKKKPVKRFSNLSNMFSRTKDGSKATVADQRPQGSRESSQQERKFDSPRSMQQQFAPQQPSPRPEAAKKNSFLAKLSTGGDVFQSRPEPKIKKSATNPGLLSGMMGESNKPREEAKMKKATSTSGLLSGIMGDSSQHRQDNKAKKAPTPGLLSGIMGRRSQQAEKQDDSSSQGTRSQGSQPKDFRPHQIPAPRTYTDLAEQANADMVQPPAAQWQQNVNVAPEKRERGRRPSRENRIEPEPQYAAVPIPGGYNLVHGDGSMAAPTGYDPRGLGQYRQQQQDPRYAQNSDYRSDQQPDTRLSQQAPTHQNVSQSATRLPHMDQQPAPSPPLQLSDRRASQASRPSLTLTDPSAGTQRASRRISREDIVARSPARILSGQQRPYQLSLPEDEEENTHLGNEIPTISPPSSVQSPASIPMGSNKPQHDAIKRLGQPTLRHPESPAGYPLPDDTVYSPINPTANNLPPPPPPKWPAHLDNQDHHHLHLGIDRSNTHRTAVSGISQMSTANDQQGMLAPSKDDRGVHPPTPPSPSITPPPSHQRIPSPRLTPEIQTTTLKRGPSPDLYDASPRLPKPVTDAEREKAVQAREQEKKKAMAMAQEEKIFYDKDGEAEDDGEVPEPVMSATSFPGQEWNPYQGVYDEFD